MPCFQGLPFENERWSKNRSPGGCLGDRLRKAIDRPPQMASPACFGDRSTSPRSGENLTGHNIPYFLPYVGELGSGLCLVGRIGSGILVGASFQNSSCWVLSNGSTKDGYDLGLHVCGFVWEVLKPPTTELGGSPLSWTLGLRMLLYTIGPYIQGAA